MESASNSVRASASRQKRSEERIDQARTGNGEELGDLLEATRDYLRIVARRLIDDDVRAKLSASDLVQETFCEAHRDFGGFQGQTHRELVAWLHRILVNNLLNHYRSYRRTQKRKVSREMRWHSGVAETQGMANPGDLTPSGILMKREASELLEQALSRLSVDHREVIRLRHHEALPFAQIGRRMNRSADAARMLWARAFERLSLLLDATS
ncbi:MAG: sigma-70 family RNA polymerase sigma factor [Planctomycetes bacterium]|nr:sigma-70 family RNA polymerase sigma factor [Planctomycetota bacterium]MBL7039676.1 sigma-70 family RNA polymerase sigma factor [Pirellulaceae bacterium]